MPHRAAVSASSSDVAQLRAWFGLSFDDVVRHTGLSRTQVYHLETGARRLTPAMVTALLPLLAVLPPLEVQVAAAAQAAADDAPPPLPPLPLAPPLPPGTPAPAPADLTLRRLECHHRAASLLAQAAALAQRARVAARWAAVLPAMLPPDPALLPPPVANPATTRATDHARWLRGWLLHHAAPLLPADVARYHALRARATGLLAEAAALGAALPAA